jgi:hypothetical protein
MMGAEVLSFPRASSSHRGSVRWWYLADTFLPHGVKKPLCQRVSLRWRTFEPCGRKCSQRGIGGTGMTTVEIGGSERSGPRLFLRIGDHVSISKILKPPVLRSLCSSLDCKAHWRILTVAIGNLSLISHIFLSSFPLGHLRCFALSGPPFRGLTVLTLKTHLRSFTARVPWAGEPAGTGMWEWEQKLSDHEQLMRASSPLSHAKESI